MDDQKAIINLQKIEIRFHLAKMLFIVVVTIASSLALISYIRHDNDRTRNYIKCVIEGSASATTQQEYQTKVERCKF